LIVADQLEFNTFSLINPNDPGNTLERAGTSVPDCAAVLALSEPGSQASHDAWLVWSGAGISAGAGILIALLIGLLFREGPVKAR
jgi:hypothetical protein